MEQWLLSLPLESARVLDLPLSDADRLAKLVPDMTTLSKIFTKDSESFKENFKGDQLVSAKNLYIFFKVQI